MASCITEQWAGYSPQVQLTVTQSSSNDTSATLSWTLKYVTNGGETASTNGVGREWEVYIDGTMVDSGTFDINGKTTTTIETGSKSVSKTHASRNVSFTVKFRFGLTWSGVEKNWAEASSSISVDAKTSYTVSYNANGGSGAPSSQTKWYGEALTLSSTKPTKTGYTFVGWGTSTTDTTRDYSAGGSYTANASDTLYAIWSKTITLTYNANGGSGAPSSQSATVYNATTNYKFTLSTTKPTRTGYTFLGWSTSSTATSSSYSAGGSITLSSSDTLYAVWSENKLTVNYYSNYATESFADAENAVGSDKNVVVRTATFYYDNEIPNGHWDYSQSGSSTYLYRTGYTATGYWGTSTSGGTLISQSTAYSSGQAMAEAVGKSLKNGNESVNLYAQWNINTYTITYDSNGGSGNMSSQNINWNDTFILSNNAFNREGYKFIGWNSYRNADNKWYVIGQGWLTEDEIVANGYEKKLYENQDELIFDMSWVRDNEDAREFTLYAIWEISGVIYIDNGTTFEPYLVYIDNGMDWELYLAYVDNGTDWNIMS